LHDDVGQRLSLLMMELDVLKNQMPLERADDQTKIHNLLGQMDELVTDVHNMSHRLHSSKLQHLGLRVALKEVCRQFSNMHRIQIDLSADFLPMPLPEAVSLCFYRVAQEAVNNAIKHSGSPRVEVQLASDESTLRMRIKDFGIGFDPAERGKGLGLVAMQERLRMIGGTLHIHSSPHIGTELVAEVSLESLPASSKSA
jgi:signal transduction histidine kinase